MTRGRSGCAVCGGRLSPYDDPCSCGAAVDEACTSSRGGYAKNPHPHRGGVSGVR